MKKNQSLYTEIMTAKDQYLVDPHVVPLSFQKFRQYLQNGNRIEYEQDYFARRRQLAVFGMAVYLEDREADKQFLEEIIWEICNEYTWALPAHLPIANQAFCSGSSEWLDLFSAETAATLAEIKSLVALSPALNQRISQEIERRVLAPYSARPWDWELLENNWSAVVGGCLGITALLELEQHSPRQKAIIERLDGAMESYLSGFAADGVCVEGVGYWGYGFGYYLYYAEKLATVLGDQRYLEGAKVRAIAAFPAKVLIRAGEYVPFSDYNAVELASGLLSFCKTFFDVAIPPLAQTSSLDFDPCYRFAQLLRNYTWTDPELFNQPIAGGQHYFQNAEWLNSCCPEDNVVFAAKGGQNSESHNHNDVGSFIFGDATELFLTDLGAGEYTRDYFNEATRYQYFVNSSRSHNVPVINGHFQAAGPFGSEAVVYQENNFSLELAEVYPESRLVSFNRELTFKEKERMVCLTDSFQFFEGENQVIESFISKYKPEVVGHKVYLRGAFSTCCLVFPTDRLTVEVEHYKNHHGVQETAYLIQFTQAMKATGKLEITVQLVDAASRQS